MMQAMWITLGFLIAFGVLMVSPSIFETGAPLFYLLMLALCLVTIFVAPDIKGSRSWLVLGPLRLQPAEFTKAATALILAWQCAKHEFEIKSWQSYAVLIAMIAAPMLLILGQSETGSALVFLSLFLALYREGFTGLFLGLGGAMILYFIAALRLADITWWGQTSADSFVIANLILAFTLLLLLIYSPQVKHLVVRFFWAAVGIELAAIMISNYLWAFDIGWVILALLVGLFVWLICRWIIEAKSRYMLMASFLLGSLLFSLSTSYVFDHILQPHQQVRIRIALGIEQDVRGKGYNVDQAKIAIGSGGFLGKGFLEGTQTKLNYVPEQDTDFIFCTIGEEQGFVGSSVLILVYSIFILRLCSLAERQTSNFGRVYGYSIAAIFFFHLFINIGMVLGLVPVIGIPLPFFSYGGSSLWGFTLMLFIFLGIDARRNNARL